MYSEIRRFVKTLREKQLRLALAESVSCGLAAHKLASCIGTSDVLAGSVVCYMPEVKTGLLKVSKKLIETYSCESMQVTEALVRGLEKLIDADIHAALTGLSGSGGSETKEKPVGTIFFCVKYQGKIYRERKLLRGSPLRIRKKACEELYRMIREIIKG